jgi:CRISPR-associated protein Csd2
MVWRDHIPEDLSNLYEIHDFKHAAAILATEFQKEFQELCTALRTFKFTEEDIITGGGNESNIPKRFSNILRPLGWKTEKLNGKLLIDNTIIRHDTPRIGYVKERVAFDLQWTVKGKNFDKYLYAFRTFYEYNQLSVAILATRSLDYNPYFASMWGEINNKYGASNSHMGKLLSRLDAGINGGCPVLVFGITSNLLKDGS